MTLLECDAGKLAHESKEFAGENVMHPAVVLRVIPSGGFLVIHGTTTPRDRTGRPLAPAEIPEAPGSTVFWVEPVGTAARVLGLDRRTYFARNAVVIIRNAADLSVIGQCPPTLFLELRRIAGFTA